MIIIIIIEQLKYTLISGRDNFMKRVLFAGVVFISSAFISNNVLAEDSGVEGSLLRGKSFKAIK